MSPTSALLVCLVVLVPLAAADTCADIITGSCSANTNCTGFSYQACTNATSFAYTGVCYCASSCARYTQTAGDMTVTLNGASPDIIYKFWGVIQSAVLAAYNLYCVTGDNFKNCCPNAVTWPSRSNTTTAMASIEEVQIPSAYGSSTSTSLIIRLSPNTNSALCTAVTYTTTAGSTTTTTTAAAGTGTTTTTAAGTGTTTTATTVAAGTGTTTTVAAGTGTTTTVAAGTGTTTTVAAGTGTTTTVAPGTGTTTTVAAGTGTTTTAAAGASTTTMTAATTTRANTSVNATIGRRRREIDPEEAMSADNDLETVLKRNRRALSFTPIVLPANTIAAITSSISVTTIIQSALSANITVTVTVTTYGTTSTSNWASHLDGSRLLIGTSALATLLAFSLRRST